MSIHFERPNCPAGVAGWAPIHYIPPTNHPCLTLASSMRARQHSALESYEMWMDTYMDTNMDTFACC